MRILMLLAALPLAVAGAASACPVQAQASRTPMVVADNAATSTPTPQTGGAGKTDTVAFPNSPNGSPASADKGAPVVTDRAACSGAMATQCEAKPAPSTKADTSDTKIATPTTVNGTAPAK